MSLFLLFLSLGSFSLGAKGPVSEEILARFAPPPLSYEDSDRIALMMDLTQPSMGFYEPSSRRLFFNWRLSGQMQVWMLSQPKGFPVQLTGGNLKTEVKALSPDGRFLALERDRNGEENPGIYLYDIAKGSLTRVFHEKKIRAQFGLFTEDSRSLVFSHNQKNGRDSLLYQYDLRTAEIRSLVEEPGTWTADSSRADFLILTNLKSSRQYEVERLDLRTLQRLPLFGRGEEETYRVVFGASPESYLVITNSRDDLQSLYEVRGGRWIPIFQPQKGEVSRVNYHPGTGQIWVNYQVSGFRKLKLFLGPRWKEKILPSQWTSSEHLEIGNISRDSFASLGIGSSRALNRISVLDLKSLKAVEWAVGTSPEIDFANFVKVQLETYEARDGTAIPMLVRRPKDCVQRLCPVVVSFHGGPEGQSDPVINPVAQAFVEEGFIFVEPNVRGSSGLGKKWLDADNGRKRLQVITDIEDAALHIRKNWSFQNQEPKIGIMGGSYGGYSTLMGMARFAGAYDAGVALVGMSNLVSFLQNTAPYRRHLRESEYGKLSEDLDALKELSPMNYIDRIRAPLLLIQGVNDPRVPVSEALQIQEALEKKGIPSSLILFADEGHGASKKENRILERGHALKFFLKHLQGR